jgi:hypothetical protein
MRIVPKVGIPEPVKDIPQDILQDWGKELEKFTTEVTEKVEEVEEEEVKEKAESALEKLLELNAYIGTLTIGGDVYSHWVFAPEMWFGKLGLGLWLPAIFAPEDGLFNVKKWNNYDEWDFRDLEDALHDLLIKFYFVQYAELGDPLYFRIGAIDNFYLGHGFLVNGYSNMVFFPEEINSGLQLNIDGGIAGIESMLGYFTRLQVFGGRVFVRPLGNKFPLAFGGSAFHDRPIPHSNSWPTGTVTEDELPRILIFGIDTELPILRRESFSLMLYADAGKKAYVYKEVPAPLSAYVEPGKIEFLKGVGTAAGVKGKIIKLITYGLEYRYIYNYYEPGMIDYLWENRRLTYQQELGDLIIAQNTAFEDTATSGYLIRGGLLLKKIEFGAGYEHYTRVVGTSEEPVNKGNIYINLHEGLIPKVYGSFTYDRKDNLEDVFKQPFNEDAVLNLNVTYQLSPIIALRCDYKRSFQYDDETSDYRPIDNFGITTVFTFF